MQEKGCHESSIAELQRKLEELRHENDVLLEKLQVSETGNNWIICLILWLSYKFYMIGNNFNSETGHDNNQQ